VLQTIWISGRSEQDNHQCREAGPELSSSAARATYMHGNTSLAEFEGPEATTPTQCFATFDL
jgi:hypothetical protein